MRVSGDLCLVLRFLNDTGAAARQVGSLAFELLCVCCYKEGVWVGSSMAEQEASGLQVLLSTLQVRTAWTNKRGAWACFSSLIPHQWPVGSWGCWFKLLAGLAVKASACGSPDLHLPPRGAFMNWSFTARRWVLAITAMHQSLGPGRGQRLRSRGLCVFSRGAGRCEASAAVKWMGPDSAVSLSSAGLRGTSKQICLRGASSSLSNCLHQDPQALQGSDKNSWDWWGAGVGCAQDHREVSQSSIILDGQDWPWDEGEASLALFFHSKDVLLLSGGDAQVVPWAPPWNRERVLGGNLCFYKPRFIMRDGWELLCQDKLLAYKAAFRQARWNATCVHSSMPWALVCCCADVGQSPGGTGASCLRQQHPLTAASAFKSHTLQTQKVRER